MGDDTVGSDSRPSGVVVIGASAGGVEAVTEAASALPADLPFAILIALHIPPSAPSVLARIVGRSTSLPVSAATDGGAHATAGLSAPTLE